jgi:hypothetical protein
LLTILEQYGFDTVMKVENATLHKQQLLAAYDLQTTASYKAAIYFYLMLY